MWREGAFQHTDALDAACGGIVYSGHDDEKQWEKIHHTCYGLDSTSDETRRGRGGFVALMARLLVGCFSPYDARRLPWRMLPQRTDPL